MTPIDINRSLTEKTDFVDKILQFKGIQAQKTDYHSRIHHLANGSVRSTPLSTSTEQLNEDVQSADSHTVTNSAASRLSSDDRVTDRSGSPVLRETNNPTLPPRSRRSSISTDSEGFPMVENESLSTSQTGQLPEGQGVEDAMSVSETMTEIAREVSEATEPGGQSQSSCPVEMLHREPQLHSSSTTPKRNPAESDDPHVSRLKGYSIKELKNFLSAHNVNYQGILEKHELLSKAVRLVKDQQNNAKIFKDQTDSPANSGLNEPDDEKDVCKICWDATIDCVLLECGHMCTCTNCAKKLNECPICREHVVRCVHVFRV